MNRTVLAALAIMTLAACGDDATGPVDNDYSYEVTVSGDMEAEFSGLAFFGSDTDDDGDAAFAILLGGQTDDDVITVMRDGAARPGVGTYDIGVPEEGSEDFVGMLITATGEELEGVFISVEGELTITESSATRLVGTVDFTATGFLGDDIEEELTVRIEGTFRARSAEHMSLRTAALAGSR